MCRSDQETSSLHHRQVCVKPWLVQRFIACLGLLVLLATPASHALWPRGHREASAYTQPRPSAAGIANATLGPASLVFPAQAVGGTSGAVIVTLSDYTTTAISISSIAVSGDFAETNNCGSSLTGSCDIYVNFLPTTTGNRTGTLTVTDTTGASAIAQLSGLGIPPKTGGTTTAITATGNSGNYSLTGTVVGTLPSGSPGGSVSFVDASNSNFSLGKVSLGTAQVELGLTNAPAIAMETPAQSLVLADFNGDGKPDLAMLNCTGICGPQQASGVWIYLGIGDGTFKLAPSEPTAPFGNDLVAGDFNGDGKMDLAVIESGSAITVMFGNGDGTFNSQSVAVPSANYEFAASGDFNKDGKSDLVLIAESGTAPNLTYNSIILYGQANGNFANGSAMAAAGDSAVVTGDFNGDGFADFAVLSIDPSSTAAVQVFLGKGDGTFQSPVSTTAAANFSIEAGNHILATGDFNGDGKTDLVIYGGLAFGTASATDGFVVLTGKGDGTFSAGSPIAIPTPVGGSNSGSVAAADFNKDGRDDVIVLNDNLVEVFLSNGDGTFTASTSVDSGAETAPNYLAMTTGDFNGDGLPDFIIADSDSDVVTLELAQRVETAAATLANVAVPGSGTHNVAAAYSGDSDFAASSSAPLPLAAAPIATTLALTSTASTTIAGASLTFTATLSPEADGTLATNGETVTFLTGGSSIGTGTLSSGVATLSIPSLPLGTDAITAQYAGDKYFAAATSSALSIVVNAPGPAVTVSAANLTFSSQATGSTSAAQSVTVTNSGSAALSINVIAASGDFAQTNTCGTSVAAGASCTISVTFTPTAPGTRSGNLTITDNAPASPQSIALSGTGSTVTVTATNSSGITIGSAGGSGTAILQIGSAGGFSGTVNLTCTVAYQGTGTANDPPSCSLNPTQEQVSAGSPASVTLTVTTTGAGSAMLLRSLGGGTALAGIVCVLLVPRRRWRGLALILTLGFAAISITACGGSGSSSGGSGTQASGTTTGNYSVTVTAASGKDTASATVPLSVQ